MIWLPKHLWRRITGYEPPPNDATIASEAAKRAEEASLRTERTTEELLQVMLSAQTGKSEESGVVLPEDAMERAIAAVQGVLGSNDPSKAKAQEALRKGDLPAASEALEAAFNREAAEAGRIGDEARQLKLKAARTARELAALAATRSVADALRWYQEATELEPEDFLAQIELARFHQIGGYLPAAMRAATEDRERSIAMDEIGDIYVTQGDRQLSGVNGHQEPTGRERCQQYRTAARSVGFP